MLPMIGPWSDSTHFTDVDMLEKIGRLNRDTAVGVLANRNITGDRFARIADGANLTAANVDAFNCGYRLIHDRTDTDQITLVTAALDRSEAAARTLCAHLSPSAALTLHRKATTTRFKGAAAVRDAIEEMARAQSYRLAAHRPGYTELFEAVHPAVPTHASHITGRAAAFFGRPDELIALAPLMAQVPDAQRREIDPDLATLLLLTYGHPHVVRAWAEHGGLLGAQIAVMDHRQDGAWILDLVETAEHPELLTAIMMVNPAVPYRHRARLRGDEFTELLASNAPRAATQIANLATGSKGLIEHGRAFDGLDVSTPEQVGANAAALMRPCTEPRLGVFVSQLLRFEVLMHGRTTPEQRSTLVQLLVSNQNLPGTMNTAILDRLGRRVPAEYYARHAILAMDPSLAPATDAAVEYDPTVADFRNGIRHPQGSPLMVLPGAELVADRIASTTQLENLYEAVNALAGDRERAHGQRTHLSELVEEAVAKNATVVADNAIYDLIPSALGSF